MTVSKSEPKDDLSDKDYAVPKSFDDTTLLDVVDNKIEQITMKQAELQCRLKDSIIQLHRAGLLQGDGGQAWQGNTVQVD